MAEAVKPKLVIPEIGRLDQLDLGRAGVCRIGFPLYNKRDTSKIVEMIQMLWAGKSTNLENTIGLANKKLVLERTPGLEYAHLETQDVSGSISPQGFYDILMEKFYEKAIKFTQSKNERYFGLDIHPEERTGTFMHLTPIVSLFFDPRGMATVDYEKETEIAAAKAKALASNPMKARTLQARIGYAR